MFSTYIIGEAGSNHNGNFLTALKLIDTAKETGVTQLSFRYLSHNNYTHRIHRILTDIII